MSVTIGFDLRCMQMGHESRGIGMHVKSLLEHLPTTPEFHYVIYAFDTNDPIKTLRINMAAPYTLVQTPAVKKSIDSPKDFVALSKIIWHRFAPLKNSALDYFIQFDFMLGLPHFPHTKTALFAYDLIPLLFRDDYIPTAGFAFRHTQGVFGKVKKVVRAVYYQARYALHYKNYARADRVLSISQATTTSLETLLHIPSAKITETPLAPVFNTTQEKSPTDGITQDDSFIFYIGATDKRKRVQDLVAAYNKVRQTIPGLRLVLAGKEFVDVQEIPNKAIKEAILKSPHRDDIVTLGYIQDDEKLWLYKHAKAFVYPTLYEGFGLPIVEAMQQGCVAISYDNSSIPEVAGDGALLVDTGNVNELTNAISHVLTDEAACESLRVSGLAQSKKFTWDNHVRQFFGALDQNIT